MGVIQREIERAGVATVSISLLKEFTSQVRPPRALWVPFPFGRPLGAPNDADIQRRVILATLDLLQRSDPPVLEDFAMPVQYEQLDAKYQAVGRKCGPKGCDLEEILAASEGNAEPVPAPYDNDLEAIRAEIAGLASAHLWYREQHENRTQVGQSGVQPGTIDRAAELVHRFVTAVPAPPPVGSEFGSTYIAKRRLAVRLSIDDLKAYYLESRLGVHDGTTTNAADANDWLWLDTRLGALLVAARDRLIDTTDRAEDPNWILSRGIVPRGYGSGGYTMTHVLEKD